MWIASLDFKRRIALVAVGSSTFCSALNLSSDLLFEDVTSNL